MRSLRSAGRRPRNGRPILPNKAPTQLLLIRPRPLDDELFTSWLVRLAWSNGEKLHPFCHRRLGTARNLWHCDLDRFADPKAISLAAAATGIAPDRLFATTLASYEGVLYEHLAINGDARWLLPVRPNSRRRAWHGQQYCPACLHEDRSPYFRRIWRLAFMVTCPRHGTLLLDACQHCGVPVSFHEGDFARRSFWNHACPITICRRCQRDLRSHEAPLADKALVAFGDGLTEVLRAGWSQLVPRQTLYGLAFFSGLHELLRILTSDASSRAVRAHLLGEMGRLCFPIARDGATSSFERLRVHDRYELMCMAVDIISGWPDRFVDACRQVSITSSHLANYGRPVPYWFDKEMRWSLYHHRYWPSAAERQSLKAYLRAHGLSCAPNNVRRWLGQTYVSKTKAQDPFAPLRTLRH